MVCHTIHARKKNMFVASYGDRFLTSNCFNRSLLFNLDFLFFNLGSRVYAFSWHRFQFQSSQGKGNLYHFQPLPLPPPPPTKKLCFDCYCYFLQVLSSERSHCDNDFIKKVLKILFTMFAHMCAHARTLGFFFRGCSTVSVIFLLTSLLCSLYWPWDPLSPLESTPVLMYVLKLVDCHMNTTDRVASMCVSVSFMDWKSSHQTLQHV